MHTQNDHIGLNINIASHLIRRKLDTFSAAYGLTGIQGRILSHLYCAERFGESIFQKDIEKAFGIRRSSVTSVISNLERGGYVERVPVKEDARLKKLLLTEKGTAVNRQISQAVFAFEDSLNDCFSKKEQAELLSLLRRLIGTLEESPCCCAENKNKSTGKDETTC